MADSVPPESDRRLYLPNVARDVVSDVPPSRLRTRGRLFRIGPRNASALALMSRVQGQSTSIRVSHEPDTETALPGIVRIEEESEKLNASTQTESTNSTRPDKEHEMVCTYLDKVSSLSSDGNDEVPPEFFCPITHHAMREPLLAADGFTYERSAIIKWLMKSSDSPCTREPLGGPDKLSPLYNNLAVKQLMQRWAREHAKRQLGTTLNCALLRV